MPLVNSRTPDAIPDEQHQGNYVLKPVSVFMYEEGVSIDTLSAAEVGEVLRYYGVDSVAGLPPVAPKEPALADVTPQRAQTPPSAFAAPYGQPAEGYAEVARRVVKKRGQEPATPRVIDACVILIDGLSEAHKESLFNRLAEQLGYDIQ